MNREEIQAEIEAIEDELDEGNRQWIEDGDGPEWAYLEVLGKQAHTLRRELAYLA